MSRPDPKAKRYDVGWWRPAQSQRWHFFGFDGRSYCGKWMHMGAELQTGNDDSVDNCSACRAKLAKAKAKAATAD